MWGDPTASIGGIGNAGGFSSTKSYGGNSFSGSTGATASNASYSSAPSGGYSYSGSSRSSGSSGGGIGSPSSQSAPSGGWGMGVNNEGGSGEVRGGRGGSDRPRTFTTENPLSFGTPGGGGVGPTVSSTTFGGGRSDGGGVSLGFGNGPVSSSITSGIMGALGRAVPEAAKMLGVSPSGGPAPQPAPQAPSYQAPMTMPADVGGGVGPAAPAPTPAPSIDWSTLYGDLDARNPAGTVAPPTGFPGPLDPSMYGAPPGVPLGTPTLNSHVPLGAQRTSDGWTTPVPTPMMDVHTKPPGAVGVDGDWTMSIGDSPTEPNARRDSGAEQAAINEALAQLAAQDERALMMDGYTMPPGAVGRYKDWTMPAVPQTPANPYNDEIEFEFDADAFRAKSGAPGPNWGRIPSQPMYAPEPYTGPSGPNWGRIPSQPMYAPEPYAGPQGVTEDQVLSADPNDMMGGGPPVRLGAQGDLPPNVAIGDVYGDAVPAPAAAAPTTSPRPQPRPDQDPSLWDRFSSGIGKIAAVSPTYQIGKAILDRLPSGKSTLPEDYDRRNNEDGGSSSDRDRDSGGDNDMPDEKPSWWPEGVPWPPVAPPPYVPSPYVPPSSPAAPTPYYFSYPGLNAAANAGLAGMPGSPWQ